MKKLWVTLVILASIGTFAALAADVATDLQVPTAQTELQLPKIETPKLTAGDVFVLTIQAPRGMEKGEPSILGELKKGPVQWGIGRILWWKPADSETGRIFVGLTSYRPEKFEVKPIVFYVDGKPAFSSAPQTVEFQPVGKQPVEEIYGPQGVSFPRWVWFLIVLLSLAFMSAVVWGLVRWAKKRGARAAEALAKKPVLPPYEEFQVLLREIEKKGYVTTGKFKPHYFGVSEGAKHFLGRAYGFDAEECTSRELIQELRRRGHDDVAVAWATLFDEMDLVKFTDQVPKLDEARSLIERAAQIGSKSKQGEKREV